MSDPGDASPPQLHLGDAAADPAVRPQAAPAGASAASAGGDAQPRGRRDSFMLCAQHHSRRSIDHLVLVRPGVYVCSPDDQCVPRESKQSKPKQRAIRGGGGQGRGGQGAEWGARGRGTAVSAAAAGSTQAREGRDSASPRRDVRQAEQTAPAAAGDAAVASVLPAWTRAQGAAAAPAPALLLQQPCMAQVVVPQPVAVGPGVFPPGGVVLMHQPGLVHHSVQVQGGMQMLPLGPMAMVSQLPQVAPVHLGPQPVWAAAAQAVPVVSATTTAPAAQVHGYTSF
eukprot:TRINITY_DN52270_c0_g1_i1.p1 TRINITY_DN52270_c0_g1~~TRINITY_DN52270_c0_g1_i1.p1  ORF type:complete len:283 (+),score=9.89 TRINITY_DN52270_c0_g1_i1:146-994(+)